MCKDQLKSLQAVGVNDKFELSATSTSKVREIDSASTHGA
jgi:hypothetical protein